MLTEFEPLVRGLLQVLSWPTPGYLLLGVAIGYVVGVLPGFGAPAALALVLPSVLGLDVTDGVVLLTAITTTCAIAGDVSSIVLGVPGEATATAIIADGRSLVRRGEGGMAIGAAVTSAWLGAAIGALTLACVLPFARPLFSVINSPELAALAILGLALVAPLSKDDPARGLAAGVLGVGIATIGLDPSRGEPRFTFGHLALWDGASLLSVALGLYAVPEVLGMIRSHQPPPGQASGWQHGFIAGGLATLRRPALVLRSAAIGVAVGMLPGVGATISQWVAYAQASRVTSSPTPLGEGAVEGVIAPATATTATFGGALTPTLLLGIPGSISTALLLGALTLKGLTPGPALLLPEQEGGQRTLVWSLLWCIVLAASAGAALSAATQGWIRAFARIRPARLVPLLLLLVIVGTVGERNALADLGLLAVFGVLGYAMSILAWPRSPLVLGFVLGPLLERRWLLAEALYGWRWVLRPGVLLIAVVTLLLLAGSRRSARVQHSQKPRPSPAGDGVLSASLVVLGLLGLWLTGSVAPRAAAFPRVVFVALLGCALLSLWKAERTWRGSPRTALAERSLHLRRLAWLVVFVGSAWLAGPAAGMAIAAGAHARVEGQAAWTRVLGTTAGLALLSWLLLRMLVPFLEAGMLFQLATSR